jgi:hypothetical protein
VVRTQVTASSNNNAKVNFGVGYKQIFITINARSFNTYASKITATGLAIALG